MKQVRIYFTKQRNWFALCTSTNLTAVTIMRLQYNREIFFMLQSLIYYQTS